MFDKDMQHIFQIFAKDIRKKRKIAEYSGRKNVCARTDTVFFPISEISKSTVSLVLLKFFTNTHNTSNFEVKTKKEKNPYIWLVWNLVVVSGQQVHFKKNL